MKNITTIKMGSEKQIIYLIIADLDSRFYNFRSSPNVLFVLEESNFRCSSNIKLVWGTINTQVFLGWWRRNTGIIKHCGRMGYLFAFRIKINFWACWVKSGLKFIFHWKSQLLINSKSLLRLFADVWVSCTKESKEVSPSNNFVLAVRPSVRLLNQKQ